jgi:hypothetical protein
VIGPFECDCFDTSTAFQGDFIEKTRSSFLSSQAFVSPQDPGFCEAANQKVCDYYQVNQSCCCQFETEAARICLVERVLPNELMTPLIEPCANDCTASGLEGSGDGGSALVLVAAAAGGGILLLLVVTCYFGWRRRRQNSAPSNEEKEVVQKKGFSFWSSKSKKDKKVDVVDKKDTTQLLELSFQGSSEEDLEKGASSDPDSYLDISSDSEEGEEPKSSEDGNVVYNSKPVVKSVQSKASLQHHQDEAKAREPAKESNTEQASKTEQLKKKRAAIESWNSEKKQGSSRSLQSFMSEEPEPVSDEDIKENKEKTESRAQGSTSPSAAAAEKNVREPKRRPSTELRSTKQRSSSSRELKQESKPKELTRKLSTGSLVTGKLDGMEPSTRSTRTSAEINKEKDKMQAKIAELEQAKTKLSEKMNGYKKERESMKMEKQTSIRRMNELVKERAGTTLRLSQLEESRGYYEGRLKAADDEGEALRKERLDAAKRIAELEAQNARLTAKLIKSSSSGDLSGDRELKERKSRRSSTKSKEHRQEPERSDHSPNMRRVDSFKDSLRKSSKRRSGSERDLSSKANEMSTSWNHRSLGSVEDWEATNK